MSLTHPTILLTAAGLALIPVAIHLINRRRHPREPWAAMTFLLAAHQTTRRRMFFEHWLLMALRCLAVLFIGLLVARPRSGGDALSTLLGQARSDRVIVLDDSFSMQARGPNGRSLFDLAKARALELVDSAPAADGLAVITASTLGKTWMHQPAHDRIAVRELIESLNCSAGADDWRSGISAAHAVLEHSDAAVENRLVYLLTDATDRALSTLPADEPTLEKIKLITIGEPSRSNWAISSLRLVGQALGAGMPLRFAVEAGHFGERAPGTANLELLVDGAAIHRATIGPVDDSQRITSQFDVPPLEPGWHRIEARLKASTPDALPDDDERRLALQVPSGFRVLLVDGRGSLPASQRELFYYSAAIGADADERRPGAPETRTVSPADIETEALDEYSVVVLGNVGGLTGGAARRLDSYVRRGGGLIVFLGYQARPDGFSTSTDAGTAQLLPLTLRERITSSPDHSFEKLRVAQAAHGALADCMAESRGGLASAEVLNHWTFSPAPASTTTLISLSHDDPAAMVSDVGRGRIVVFAFGATMSDSNLPAKPDFVPLMVNLTAYASAGRQDDPPKTVGDRLAWIAPASADESQVQWRSPLGGTTPCESRRLDDGAASFSIPSADEIGFYSVQAGGRRALFAVNAEAGESDLSSMPRDLLAKRVRPKLECIESSRSDSTASLSPSREIAPVVGACLLFAMISEMFLMIWFGGRR